MIPDECSNQHIFEKYRINLSKITIVFVMMIAIAGILCLTSDESDASINDIGYLVTVVDYDEPSGYYQSTDVQLRFQFSFGDEVMDDYYDFFHVSFQMLNPHTEDLTFWVAQTQLNGYVTNPNLDSISTWSIR